MKESTRIQRADRTPDRGRETQKKKQKRRVTKDDPSECCKHQCKGEWRQEQLRKARLLLEKPQEKNNLEGVKKRSEAEEDNWAKRYATNDDARSYGQQQNPATEKLGM